MNRSLGLFGCGTAVGAIIVGAVSSQAASWLITSPNQIKPGVISLRNLSLSTRRALRGTVGQRGPAGPAGLRRPKGDSGQAVIADGSVSTGSSPTAP